MITHERCVYCNQRKGMSEYTKQCPERTAYGHSWETVAGNGIGWNESLIGKLWASKIGKIVIIIALFILFILFS